jgi:hypothetical protein
MNDRITIEGRDGAFGAYISQPKTSPTSARPATNWRNKASLRSRRTYSGVRSRASTSASPPRPTGNTAFVSIRPMTETPAPGTLRTRSMPWPTSRGALAGLPSSATASAD